MNTHRLNKLLSTILICALAGCTSISRFTLPDEQVSLVAEVDVGDQVRIVTRNGAEHEVTVQRFSDTAICGPHDCYEYRELQKISVESFSWLKTTATAVGTFLVMAAVAAASVGSVL